MPSYQDGMHNDNGWIVFGVFVLALIIAITVAFLMWNDRRNRSAPTDPPELPATKSPATEPSGSRALRLLEERFARGEIDADEFRLRRELLHTQS